MYVAGFKKKIKIILTTLFFLTSLFSFLSHFSLLSPDGCGPTIVV